MGEITYMRVGDYLLPDIKLADTPDAPPMGRYGTLYKAYLREHRLALCSELLLSEKLYPLCREIDEAARHRRRLGATEEIILAELVYN